MKLIALGLTLSGFLSAQNRSITFEHTSWTEIKAKAKKENKLIFIDAYTTWCGPCKYLSRTIFTNDTVADFYNANFINAKFDMEKGEGLELAKQYEVSCYPNLLFVDGNGNLVHRTAGAMEASYFVELGKTAKNDSKNFSYYTKNYEAKKSDADFLMNYIEARSNTCLDASAELVRYFSLQSENDLWSEANWNMIRNYSEDLNSREFKFLVANKAKLGASYGEAAVNEKISDVLAGSLRKIIKARPFHAADYEKAKEQIAGLHLPEGSKILFESDLYQAKTDKNWKKFTELAVTNIDTYYSDDSDKLNSVAWDFYEQVSDKAALLKAEQWAKRSTELHVSYANLDTYASLLYKNGKKSEALVAANKAIEYAKKENYSADDYKETSELIVKIKAMK